MSGIYEATTVIDGNPYTVPLNYGYEDSVRELLFALRTVLYTTGQNWLSEIFDHPSPVGSDPTALVDGGGMSVLNGDMVTEMITAFSRRSHDQIHDNPLEALSVINNAFDIRGVNGQRVPLIGTNPESFIVLTGTGIDENGGTSGVRNDYAAPTINRNPAFSGVRFGFDRESLAMRIREVIRQPVNSNMIDYILLNTPKSRIKVRTMDANGTESTIIIQDAVQYRAYLNQLSCFWVAFEVVYGISDLMQFVRNKLGETGTIGHKWVLSRSNPDLPELKLPMALWKAQENGNELVYQALAQLATPKFYTDLVDIEDLIHVVDWARIEIYLLDGTIARKYDAVRNAVVAQKFGMNRFIERYTRRDLDEIEEATGATSSIITRAGWLHIHPESTSEISQSILPLGVTCVYQQIKHLEAMLDCVDRTNAVFKHIHFCKTIDTSKLAIRGRTVGEELEEFMNRPLRLERRVPVASSIHCSIRDQCMDDAIVMQKMVSTAKNISDEDIRTGRGCISSCQGWVEWVEAWIEEVQDTVSRCSMVLQSVEGIGDEIERELRRKLKEVWNEFYESFPYHMDLMTNVMRDRDAVELMLGADAPTKSLQVSDFLLYIFKRLEAKDVKCIVLSSANLKPVRSAIHKVLKTIQVQGSEVPTAMDTKPVDAVIQSFVLEVRVPGVGPTIGKLPVVSLCLRHKEYADPSDIVTNPNSSIATHIKQLVDKVHKAFPELNKNIMFECAEKLYRKDIQQSTVLFELWERSGANRYNINSKMDAFFASTDNKALSHAFVFNQQVNDQPIMHFTRYQDIQRLVDYDGTTEKWEAIEEGTAVLEPMVEIDFKSHYQMLDFGAYSSFFVTDMFGTPMMFGGFDRCSHEALNDQVPLVSYIADYGKVWFQGSKCNWELMDELVPGKRLSQVSSFAMLYNEKRLILNSHVISFCNEICQLKGIVDKVQIFNESKRIQFEILGLKEGMFALRLEQRAILKGYFFKNTTPGTATWEKLDESPLGDEASSFIRNKFFMPLQPVCQYPPRDEDGNILPTQLSTANTTPSFARSGKEMMCAKQVVFKSAMDLLPEELGDIYEGKVWGPELGKVKSESFLKEDYRRAIGISKFLTKGKGGVRLMQHSSILHDYEEDRNSAKSRGRLTADRRMDMYNPVNKKLQYLEWASSGGHFLMHDPLPQLPDYSVVGIGSVQACAQINGIGEWRNMILAMSHMVMDKITMRFNVYQMKTDSVLVKAGDAQALRSFLDALYLPELDRFEEKAYKIPGHTALYRAIPHNFIKGNMSEKTAQLLHRIVTSRGTTRSDVNADGYFCGERPEIERALETLRVPWKTKKDSDAFKQFVLMDNGIPKEDGTFMRVKDHLGIDDPVAISGKELHYKCWEQCEPGREFVSYYKKLYKRFTLSSAKLLVAKKGGLMVGEPGAGKSTRVKHMLDLITEEEAENSQMAPPPDDDSASEEEDYAKPAARRVAFLAPMHSILRDFREFEDRVRVATVDSFFGTGYSMEKLSRNTRKHVNDFGKSVGKYLHEVDTIVVDEIETTRHAAGKFLAEMKQRGKSLYFVGDPYQTTPPFGRAMDLGSDEMKRMCNGFRYVFDLQFRNNCEAQNRLLDEIVETGQVTKYLSPEMGQYVDGVLRDGDDMVTYLDDLLHDIAISIMDNKEPEHTVSFQNYKVMGMFWVEVNRRLMMHPDFAECKDWLLLYRTGNSVEGDMSMEALEQMEQSEVNVDKYWAKVANVERIVRAGRSTVQLQRNGAPGRNFLTGIVLMMIPGQSYVPTEGFRSKFKHEFVHPEGSRTWFKFFQQTRYIFRGSETHTFMGHKLSKRDTPGRAIPLHMRVFMMEEQGTGMLLYCTEAEAAMFLMPSYMVLDTFVVGATLNKFTVLNAHRPGGPQCYRSIRESLTADENDYGKLSVHTKSSRAIRVARTRVRSPDDSAIVDMRIDSHRFWYKFYFCVGENFGHFEELLSERQQSVDELRESYKRQEARMKRMCKVITYGNLQLGPRSHDPSHIPVSVASCTSAGIPGPVNPEIAKRTMSFPTEITFDEMYDVEDDIADTEIEETQSSATQLVSQDSDYPGNQMVYFGGPELKRVRVV